MRKYALQLLSDVLRTNPFGPTLDPVFYHERINEAIAWLEKNGFNFGATISKVASSVAPDAQDGETKEDPLNSGSEDDEGIGV